MYSSFIALHDVPINGGEKMKQREFYEQGNICDYCSYVLWDMI